MLLADYGMTRPAEAMPKAKAAALAALKLDAGLAEAHTSLALLTAVYEWRWEQAGRHFRRALELNPGSAQAHHWYGYDCLGPQGKLDQALAEVETALQLDPLSMIIRSSLGALFLTRREYDRAIAHSQHSLRLDPQFYKTYTILGRAYFLKAQYEEAIQCFEKARALSSGAHYLLGGLGQSYAMAGQKAKARKALRELLALGKRNYVPALSVAMIHAGLGDLDSAFQWLDQAYRNHEGNLVYLNVYPAYDCLRPDPRFQALVAKVGL